jgi:DNA end-binding protein Ku
VSVPVKVYSAVSSKSVRFHQLHATDHARVELKRFCSAEEREVPYEEIVKGYELAPGRHVVIEPDELAALEPASNNTIEIEDFVELTEIDPIYFDQPYHLVPGEGAAKPYRLLLETMSETGKVAMARIVLRSRERLVAIRPRGQALLMIAMNYGDEINSPDGLPEMQDLQAPLSKRELAVARRLVESIAEPFDVSKYHDTYREAVLDLIDRKAAGEEIVAPPSPKQPALKAPDLMAALEASLEEVRRGGDGKGKKPKRAGAPAGKPAGKREAATAAAASNGKSGAEKKPARPPAKKKTQRA